MLRRNDTEMLITYFVELVHIRGKRNDRQAVFSASGPGGKYSGKSSLCKNQASKREKFEGDRSNLLVNNQVQITKHDKYNPAELGKDKGQLRVL